MNQRPRVIPRVVTEPYLAGFRELNPQIARDVRQTALAGPPMLHDQYPQDAGPVLGS